jgi:hypothetical protein
VAHRRSISRTIAAASVAALAGAVAGPAHAGNRVEIGGDHLNVVVAECADGAQVDGPLEGSYSEHPRFDRQGNLISVALTMEYKMTWTLSTTGASVYPHGTRHLVFDFVEGTITETGNYRTLTVSGEGRVLKYAGRSVLDLATGAMAKSGPAVADIGIPEVDNDLVCGLFGVDGA